MSGAKHPDLEHMSYLELLSLQEEIHKAIRRAIRAKNEEMAARSRPAAPREAPAEAPAGIDLARERDAWLARKRAR
ncbi:MAG: hypothetical protein JSS20_11265 [Proteobacteria bacterium]|nr:hypothetical protein [Pseudomonadota bacterium]